MCHSIIRHNGWRGSFLKCMWVSLLIALPARTVAKQGEKESRWVDKPIVIDGNNEEWPQPYPFKEDNETKIQYAIANDAQTLYLTLKSSDEATKMKLRKNGFIVIIDTTGKKLNTLLFDFTIPARSSADKPDTGQKLNIATVRVKGTAAYDGTYSITGNKPGIAAGAITNDFSEVVAEIAIPFKCIYANVGGHVAMQDRISVCFTFFGLTNEDFDAMQRAGNNTINNAMPVQGADSSNAKPLKGGGTPARGGGKAKGKDNTSVEPPPDIDAVSIMLDRSRATQDNQVWKKIRLSYGHSDE
jgi:hypothetical protein